MMAAHLCHLLLVALDTPVGTDVVSVNEAVFGLLGLGVCEAGGKRSHDDLSGDIHLNLLK